MSLFGTGNGQQQQGMRLKEALAKLSADLVPTETYYRNAKTAADDVFKILQASRKDVSRVTIGGSIGKRTAISYERIPGSGTTKPADVDVVVFLNSQTPPWDNVLREFKEVFARTPGITIRNDKDKFFISLEYRGIQVDVSPAPNLATPACTQRSKVMGLINVSTDKSGTCRLYGSGLGEDAVEFMKRQSEVHPLIRLAKFWNSRVKIDKKRHYVLARSYLIECVAVRAHRLTLANKGSVNPVVVESFVQFLELMSEFSTLKINLSKDATPAHLQGERALILDPINRYNNLAAQNPAVIAQFMTDAKSTLRKLQPYLGNVPAKTIGSIHELMGVLTP